VDALTRKRRLKQQRDNRYRRRQRKETIIVDVSVSLRVLVCLLETGLVSEAELAAGDRSADGPIARGLARLHEAAVTTWEVREGRITTDKF
jgi:hypothetical protein